MLNTEVSRNMQELTQMREQKRTLELQLSDYFALMAKTNKTSDGAGVSSSWAWLGKRRESEIGRGFACERKVEADVTGTYAEGQVASASSTYKPTTTGLSWLVKATCSFTTKSFDFVPFALSISMANQFMVCSPSLIQAVVKVRQSRYTAPIQHSRLHYRPIPHPPSASCTSRQGREQLYSPHRAHE
jgi:hypothetical protein